MRCLPLTAAAALGLMLAGTALAQEPIPPSKWGPADEIGATNLLTPAKVLEATKLVTTGKTYRLGIVVDRSTPAFPPRGFSVTVLAPNQPPGVSFGSNKMNYLDDIVMGWLGVGSQIDGFAHLGTDNVFYNQNKLADFFDTTGVKKLGIHNVPPIVTRGVVLDVAKVKGKPMLDAGEIVTVADIQAAERAAGVSPGRGDVVILHTGWLDMLDRDAKAFGAGEPGIDAAGAKYLAGKEVVAVGADTWGVEAVPFAGDKVWEGHQVLLAQNGIHILETMDTRELVRDGVTEFMFVLGVPRYRGSIQAIINPIAIR